MWLYCKLDRECININENMAKMLANIPEALVDLTNLLHCEIDLPLHDLLVYMHYDTSCYETSSMQSI